MADLIEGAVEALPPSFDFVPDGPLERAMNMLGTTQDKFIELLLSNRYEIPMDKELTERARHIPPQTFQGLPGAHKSNVLVIGKMPNNFEANTGVPFVGAAGNLLREFFKSKDIDIGGWMVTYAVPFRVPEFLAGKGQIKVGYLKDGLAVLSKTVEAVNPKFVLLFGADALKAWNTLYDKKRASAEKFSNSRGTVLKYPDGRMAVCSISPNDVVNDPAQTQEFHQDLSLFTEVITTGGRKTTINPTVEVVNSLPKLKEVVDKLISQSDKLKYSVDLEWGPKEGLRTMQIANSKEYCAVLHFHEALMVPTDLQESYDQALPELKRLFHRPGVGIIGHNVRGDIKILRTKGLDLLQQFMLDGFDTMVGYHVIPGHEERDKQLELVSFCLLGTDRYDKPVREWLRSNGYGDERLAERAYGDIPDNLLIPYGAMDACCTYGIYEVILEEMKKWPGVVDLYYKVCHPVNQPLLEMEENGVLVDMDRLLSLSDLFLEKRAQMLAEIQKEIGWEPRVETVTVQLKTTTKVKTIVHDGFNPDSVDHMRELLFGLVKVKNGEPQRKAPPNVQYLNLEPVKATTDAPWEDIVAAKKTHLYSPSTDSESLGILAIEHPIAKKLQQYRFVGQICKTFLTEYTRQPNGKIRFEGGIGAALSDDNRMRTRFRTTLETGRYSSTPNVQAFPKKQEKELQAIFKDASGKLDPRYKSIRSVFVARPGYVLCEFDWNQAELWTLGYIANDQKFIQALKTSDIHSKTTLELFPNIAVDGKRLGDMSVDQFNKFRKENKVADAYRGVTKTIIFGVAYCRGPKAVSREITKEGIEFTPEQAKAAINSFFTSYPDIARYVNECKEAVISPGYIQGVYGRYRMAGVIEDEGKIAAYQRQFVNFR